MPLLQDIKAKSINTVRNQLLEHPKVRENFTQSLVITDAGPVLRSRAEVIVSSTGIRPVDESLDKGLRENAEALRDELERKFHAAAQALAS